MCDIIVHLSLLWQGWGQGYRLATVNWVPSIMRRFENRIQPAYSGKFAGAGVNLNSSCIRLFRVAQAGWSNTQAPCAT
jgi:hypothetical protein